MGAGLFLVAAVVLKLAGVSHWWVHPLLGVPVWGWGVVAAIALSRSSHHLGMGSMVATAASQIDELEGRVAALEDLSGTTDDDETGVPSTAVGTAPSF